MEARRAYPRIYHKTDKLGRPIYIERIGAIDLNTLWKVTTNERMLKNHVYEYEKLVQYRLKACSIKAGRHHEQSLSILDLNGVALSTFSSVYATVSEISTIAQNYYPEMYPFFHTGWARCISLMPQCYSLQSGRFASNYWTK